jgi:hypothetical protein
MQRVEIAIEPVEQRLLQPRKPIAHCRRRRAPRP